MIFHDDALGFDQFGRSLFELRVILFDKVAESKELLKDICRNLTQVKEDSAAILADDDIVFPENPSNLNKL